MSAKVKRFTPEANMIGKDPVPYMEESSDGDYVEYQAYLDLLAESEWVSSDQLPENDDPVAATELYRYKRYKPNSQQFKNGIKGRWQRFNGYGWDNSEPPNEWKALATQAEEVK